MATDDDGMVMMMVVVMVVVMMVMTMGHALDACGFLHCIEFWCRLLHGQVLLRCAAYTVSFAALDTLASLLCYPKAIFVAPWAMFHAAKAEMPYLQTHTCSIEN